MPFLTLAGCKKISRIFKVICIMQILISTVISLNYDMISTAYFCYVYPEILFTAFQNFSTDNSCVTVNTNSSSRVFLYSINFQIIISVWKDLRCKIRLIFYKSNKKSTWKYLRNYGIWELHRFVVNSFQKWKHSLKIIQKHKLNYSELNLFNLKTQNRVVYTQTWNHFLIQLFRKELWSSKRFITEKILKPKLIKKM